MAVRSHPRSATRRCIALRIWCKRLRYLFEFFCPTNGDLLKAEITRLKELQDVLGEFQDACVASHLLHRYADALPMRSGNRGQLIALDHLIAGQDRRAALRRVDFAHAWERFDSPGGRAGLLTRLAESRA